MFYYEKANVLEVLKQLDRQETEILGNKRRNLDRRYGLLDEMHIDCLKILAFSALTTEQEREVYERSARYQSCQSAIEEKLTLRERRRTGNPWINVMFPDFMTVIANDQEAIRASNILAYRNLEKKVA